MRWRGRRVRWMVDCKRLRLRLIIPWGVGRGKDWKWKNNQGDFRRRKAENGRGSDAGRVRQQVFRRRSSHNVSIGSFVDYFASDSVCLHVDDNRLVLYHSMYCRLPPKHENFEQENMLFKIMSDKSINSRVMYRCDEMQVMMVQYTVPNQSN